MKKTIALLSAAFVLLGFTSCSKDGGNGENASTGSLTVKFAFDQTVDPGGKAYTQSTAMPTTSWVNNIKSMMILFVDGSNIVKDVRDITLSTSATTAGETRQFNNVAAGTYTAYIVANYNQPGIAAKYQTPTGTTWDLNSVKGKNINDLLLHLTAYTNWATEKDAATEASAVAYNEAGEVFLAKQSGIIVVADQTRDYTVSHPFALTRAVSLFRVRINPTAANTGVDFTNANSSLRIRRVATYANPNSAFFPTTPSGDNLVYAKQFSVAAPVGYTASTLASIIDQANGQTCWKDVRIFPGGSGTVSDPSSGTNSSKFDIVITGWAPAGYVTANGHTIPAGGGKVYWQGTVQGAITANNILEVNVTLNSKGNDGEVPPVVETGNLIISVNLVGWQSIYSTNMDI